MIFPKKTLSDFSSTFMTSFYLSQDQKPLLNQLVRQFPTITVIEMDVVLEQIREIIDEVSAIIELVLVLVIAAGSLVLISGVQASLDSRMTESAVLRVMGARKKLILGGLLINFRRWSFCGCFGMLWGRGINLYSAYLDLGCPLCADSMGLVGRNFWSYVTHRDHWSIRRVSGANSTCLS